VSLRPVFCATSSTAAIAIVEAALRVEPPDALRSPRVVHTGCLTAKLEGLAQVNYALDASAPNDLVFYPSEDWFTSRLAYLVAAVIGVMWLHLFILAARTTYVEVPMVWVLDKETPASGSSASTGSIAAHDTVIV
jgi:hypothetical protein